MATNYFLVSHKTKTMVFCGVRTGMGGARGTMGAESRVLGAFIAVPEHQGAVLLSEGALEGIAHDDYVDWNLENHAHLYEIATGSKLYSDASDDE